MEARWSMAALALFAAGALAQDKLPTPPPGYAAYAEAVRRADALVDDEARCRAYPDLPGNTWAEGAGAARCVLLAAPMFRLEDIDERVKTPAGLAEVDSRLRALMQAHYDDPAQRELIFRAYSVFWREEDAEHAEQTTRAWFAAAPDSPFAKAALGTVLAHRGWAARGKKYAQETPDENFRKFDEYVRAATPLLASAFDAEPKLLPACIELSQIGRHSSLRLHEHVLKRCIDADPASYYVVAEMEASAEPRWRGSQDAMRVVDAYAQARVVEHPILAGLTVRQAGYDAELARDDATTLATLRPLALRAPRPNYLEQVAFAHARAGQWWDAYAWTSQAMRYKPRDPSLTRLLADAAWAVEGPAAARPYLEQAMALDATSRESTWGTLCRSYLMEGAQDLDGALKCTAAFTEAFPKNGDAWRYRYVALVRTRGAGIADAARHFLAYQDAERWPEHAKLAVEVRNAMLARGEPLELGQ